MSQQTIIEKPVLTTEKNMTKEKKTKKKYSKRKCTCVNCGVNFLAKSGSLFHSASCRNRYYYVNKTKKDKNKSKPSVTSKKDVIKPSTKKGHSYMVCLFFSQEQEARQVLALCKGLNFVKKGFESHLIPL